MHPVLDFLHSVQRRLVEVHSRSSVASIDDEHGYLFRSQRAELRSSAWAEAACRDAYPEIFFPISVHDSVSRAEALAYCESCTIRSACLDVALRDRNLVGIWGGTDEEERARLRRSHLCQVG